ncbi:sensor histidine kinase [Sphaerotilus uruguayifluvii]|uniref:histidine kinase n=1 Tax=Sphaerotilus uruguayifluvii TaxID=2735897 RepID=A0ABX2G9X9_9BURK|nr:GAF domain-containing sensor histidine kinase [Leptothrix sp. C29]NRT58362.1 hypothetical protein [Leptothrix sp. C29]
MERDRLDLPADYNLRHGRPRLSLDGILNWVLTEEVVDSVVRDPARIRLAHGLALLSHGRDEPLNELVSLARTLLQAPVAFLGAIGEDFDFYKGLEGAGEPFASERKLTGRTFCHYTHAAGSTLALSDVRGMGAPWCDVPTVHSMGIAAYLGTPVRIQGHVVASLCCVDFQPRTWTDRDQTTIEALAISFQRELEYRVSLESWRRAAEDREELIRHAERLVAGVAHDLRNPMMVTQLCAVTLTSKPAEHTARAVAPRLRRANEQMRSLIESLQTDWITPSSPRDLAAQQVSELLRQSQKMYQIKGAQGGVVVSIGQTCEAQVLADSGQILRALSNLVSNAVKFSPDQGNVVLSAHWLSRDNVLEAAKHDGKVAQALARAGEGTRAGWKSR